jgi:hypothetical protein
MKIIEVSNNPVQEPKKKKLDDVAFRYSFETQLENAFDAMRHRRCSLCTDVLTQELSKTIHEKMLCVKHVYPRATEPPANTASVSVKCQKQMHWLLQTWPRSTCL